MRSNNYGNRGQRNAYMAQGAVYSHKSTDLGKNVRGKASGSFKVELAKQWLN